MKNNTKCCLVGTRSSYKLMLAKKCWLHGLIRMALWSIKDWGRNNCNIYGCWDICKLNTGTQFGCYTRHSSASWGSHLAPNNYTHSVPLEQVELQLWHQVLQGHCPVQLVQQFHSSCEASWWPNKDLVHYLLEKNSHQ